MGPYAALYEAAAAAAASIGGGIMAQNRQNQLVSQEKAAQAQQQAALAQMMNWNGLDPTQLQNLRNTLQGAGASNLSTMMGRMGSGMANPGAVAMQSMGGLNQQAATMLQNIASQVANQKLNAFNQAQGGYGTIAGQYANQANAMGNPLMSGILGAAGDIASAKWPTGQTTTQIPVDPSQFQGGLPEPITNLESQLPQTFYPTTLSSDMIASPLNNIGTTPLSTDYAPMVNYQMATPTMPLTNFQAPISVPGVSTGFPMGGMSGPYSYTQGPTYEDPLYGTYNFQPYP
jgi:hypothetical protein